MLFPVKTHFLAWNALISEGPVPDYQKDDTNICRGYPWSVVLSDRTPTTLDYTCLFFEFCRPVSVTETEGFCCVARAVTDNTADS